MVFEEKFLDSRWESVLGGLMEGAKHGVVVDVA